MKLVRSDSPEVATIVASARALACLVWSALTLVCIACVLSVLIALAADLIVSTRAAVWLGVPLFLVLSMFLLWRGRSTRLNWVIAVGADRMCVRLFTRRGRKQADVEEPEIMVLEAAEIASMSARTIELFLYGPKPKIIEWLVIRPAKTIANDVFDYIRPFQSGKGSNVCGISPSVPDKQVYVGDEDGSLTIEWKWRRPAVRTFLQRVAQHCPSIVVGADEHSELDLNGIWHGVREEPNAQQRRLLVQATHLGFGQKCVELLSLYRFGTFPSNQKATAYLEEIERENAETERATIAQ